VQRSGATWTISTSTNGVNYTAAASFAQNLTVSAIGLYAWNYNATASKAAQFTGLVDYFHNVTSGSTAPDLTIAKSHTGNFTQGATGTYTLTASNIGTAPTSGTVTVTDNLPAGLSPASASGTGWSCGISAQTVTCTSSTVVAAGANFPSITLAVNVASNAGPSVTNTATVSGGGETNTFNDSASDVTTISTPSGPVITAVSATTTAGTAYISWTTNELATSRVDYGSSTSYGSNVSSPTLVTSHTLSLSGLTCGVTYDFSVTSVDPNGKAASSPNATLSTAACVSGGPVSDNLDGSALNTALWTLTNPLSDGNSAMSGYSLVLSVPQGTAHDASPGTDDTMRAMQNISNVDFEVETRFQSSVMFARQREGIIVQQDANTFLRFDVSNDGSTSRVAATGFTKSATNSYIDAPIPSSGPPVWLRVSRAGNTWTEWYSTDGVTFASVGQFTLALNVTEVGPFSGNNGTAGVTLPAMNAEVDYFFNTAAPVSNSNSDGPLPFGRAVIDPNPPPTTLIKILADIDGDGFLDAVIGFGVPPGATSGDGLVWYRYPHSGNPNDPWQKFTILSSGAFYEDGVAFDVNGDGAVDIITSYSNGDIYWFENPRGSGGDPTIGPWPTHFIGTGTGENNMILADIDGDGLLDLVTNGFVFFQNNPYSWTAVPLPRSSNGVALLDIGSGNGAINIVGMGASAPYPFVWLENPRETGGNARTGTWNVHVIGPAYTTTGTPATYAAADFNGDGRMDIVTASAETNSPFPILWWQAPVDR
jgi:uncharacterized repeat protein (TIGR01451 family)